LPRSARIYIPALAPDFKLLIELNFLKISRFVQKMRGQIFFFFFYFYFDVGGLGSYLDK
jgi:hypothetical protein